jgi:hypothetical protein
MLGIRLRVSHNSDALLQGGALRQGTEGVNEPMLDGEEREPIAKGQPIGWGLFSRICFEGLHAAARTSYVALRHP